MVAVIAVSLAAMLALRQMPRDIFPTLGIPTIYVAQLLLDSKARRKGYEGSLSLTSSRSSNPLTIQLACEFHPFFGAARLEKIFFRPQAERFILIFFQHGVRPHQHRQF